MDQSEDTGTQSRRVATGVRLSPQFVNRLCSRLETSQPMPRGVSGLLFGTAHEHVIVVQAFRSLLDADIAAIDAGELSFDDAVTELARAAEADPGLAPLDVLGWYSFRPLGGLHEADIEFHNRQYPSMPELALIVRRAEAGYLLFEFYANGEGGRLSETDHRWGASRFSPSQAVSGPVEIALRPAERLFGNTEHTGEDFPRRDTLRDFRQRRPNPFSILDTDDDLTGESEERAKSRQRPITTGALPEVPAVLQSARRNSLPIFSSAILFAVAAGLTFAYFAFRGVPSSGPFWRSLLFSSGLNLRVEGQGDRVLLSWNRRNSIVRIASGAILHINDGLRSRDVRLDPAQVENGAVLYRPVSDDVSFRLEVRGQDGTSVAENLRVLDSGGPHTQLTDLSASTQPGELASTPVTNVEVPHNWQPAPLVSRVDVPQPAPRLQPPAPGLQQDDARRLKAPETQTAGTAAPTTATPPPSSPAGPDANSGVPASLLTQNTFPSATPILKPTTDTQPSALTPPATTSQSLPNSVNPLPANTPAPTRQVKNTEPVIGRYTPPKPIRQVLPDISDLEPKTVAAVPEVDVIVMVDQTGHVTHVQVDRRGRRAPKAIVIAAENAARQWVFDPARLDGRSVPSEHSIVFQFGR